MTLRIRPLPLRALVLAVPLVLAACGGASSGSGAQAGTTPNAAPVADSESPSAGPTSTEVVLPVEALDYCVLTKQDLAVTGVAVDDPKANTAGAAGGAGAYCFYGKDVEFDVFVSSSEAEAKRLYRSVSEQAQITAGTTLQGPDESRAGRFGVTGYGWAVRQGKVVMTLKLPTEAAAVDRSAQSTANAALLGTATWQN